MTIRVSKEIVDELAVAFRKPIEVKGTCDLCGRQIHGMLGMLGALELQRTGEALNPPHILLHNDAAVLDCPNAKAKFVEIQ